MKAAELQKKLYAAARAQAPDETVPYAFEQRISALIRARSLVDNWAMWTRGLWRAAVACVALAIIMATVSYFAPDTRSTTSEDLSQEFENTMLASVDQPDTSTLP